MRFNCTQISRPVPRTRGSALLGLMLTLGILLLLGVFLFRAIAGGNPASPRAQLFGADRVATSPASETSDTAQRSQNIKELEARLPPEIRKQLRDIQNTAADRDEIIARLLEEHDSVK